jgi:hypothetical protein
MKKKLKRRLWLRGITLAVIIIFLILVRGLSGEDDWLCQDGVRIKHGNPSAPMPNEKCETTLP